MVINTTIDFTITVVIYVPIIDFDIIDARVISVCFCVCATEPEVFRCADTSCLVTT